MAINHPNRLIIPGHDDIYLRLTSPNDFEELYALIDRNRDHIGSFQQWAVDATPENTKKRLQDALDGTEKNTFLQYRIIRKADDKMIGVITFYEHDAAKNTVGLGYWLDKDNTGHGYVTAAAKAALDYAFKEWGVEKVKLEIIPRNGPSEKTALRIGAHPTDFYTNGPMREYPDEHRVWEIFPND